MKTVKQPWIGLKVVRTGRDEPKESFGHAFRRGADFIAVGMFKWQVRDAAAFIRCYAQTYLVPVSFHR